MRFAAAILGLFIAAGCGGLLVLGRPAPPFATGVQHEAVIDLAPSDPWQSPLGLFPPTEWIEPERFRFLGVKQIDRSLLGDEWPIETRRTPDGAYLTQIGEALFLTQRPRFSSPAAWTLRVPPGTAGRLRVVAVAIDGRIGLGVERAGDFARLAWDDGDWSFVLFDVGCKWGIERLVPLAASVR